MARTSPAARTLLRHSDRVNEIVSVVARYGFASWVDVGLPASLSAFAARVADESLVEMTEGERMRAICLELGTTFIKIGQILSTRGDMVGVEVAEALSTLQADVPPDAPELVTQTITEQLGAPPEEIFASFDPEPLGSGSIAQVHKAELPDGTDVVVKVQHHGIADVIKADLEILDALAQLVEENNPDAAIYRPVEITAQLRRSLLAEINFRLESANLAAFRENFADEPDVVIPEPFPAFSADEVLTMSRLEGSPLSSVISDLGDRAEAVVRRGADIYVEMIFRDSLFHADPHPGNILVTEDSVGLLDFGKVGRVDDETQEIIDELVVAALGHDLDGLVDSILRMCDPPNTLDRSALRRDMAGWIDQYALVGAANADIGGGTDAATAIMRRHRLYAPPDVALLLRTLTQLQGMLVATGVDLHLVDVLQPYATLIAAKRFAPDRVARKMRRTARGWEQLADTFPVEMSAILQGIRLGQIEVPLRVQRLDRNVNRLVYAIITAAMFQGSARLWSSNSSPTVGNVSVPGAIGTVTASYFAMRLLRASKRAGGLG